MLHSPCNKLLNIHIFIETKRPIYQPDVNYFDSYWLLYQSNEKLIKSLVDMSLERNLLLKRIINIEVKIKFYLFIIACS